MADIDVAIGGRLRALRQARSMTLGQVGDRLGVRAQQVHKYEAGLNRVSAPRLFELAQLFGVPVGSFFEDVRRAPDRRSLPADGRGLALARHGAEHRHAAQIGVVSRAAGQGQRLH